MLTWSPERWWLISGPISLILGLGKWGKFDSSKIPSSALANNEASQYYKFPEIWLLINCLQGKFYSWEEVWKVNHLPMDLVKKGKN